MKHLHKVTCLILLALLPVIFGDSAPIITTKDGPIQGTSDSNSNMYLGIPFAQPPINSLRWMKPLKNKPWSPNTLDATDFQAACPQANCSTRMPAAVCPPKTSEDCLYLNVFVPKTASPTPRAVMLFIHGGNFQFQGANSMLIDGRYMANLGDVVIVTIQYRLGALGFLVTGLESDQIGGNLGIMDQKLAIQWINDNIAAFGGDPSKITLFGQSAGAQSIMIHMLSKDMQGQFNNAIFQSSPVSIPYRKFDEAMMLYVYFRELLNCEARDVACLRSKTVDQILSAQMAVETKVSSVKLLEFFEPWLPWIDGKIVKGQVLEFEKWGVDSKFVMKPFIIGTLSEEAYIYIFSAFGKPISAFNYGKLMIAGFKEHAVELIKNYPPNFAPDADQRELVAKVATHWVFSCGTRHFLEQVMNMSQNKANYYTYEFDYALDFPGWSNFTMCTNHVCHGSDVVYTFDTADQNFTSTGRQISYQQIRYWSNFAKTNSPNPPSSSASRMGRDYHNINNLRTGADLVWPAYDMATKPYLHVQGPGNTIEKAYLKTNCDFFDSIGYYF